MFGFSKYTPDPERKQDKYKSKRGKSSKKKSNSGIYFKRSRIQSDSGLCAMDHKTLKLLMEMDNNPNNGTNGNNHICQVTNTFTQNGRYTQIICTRFTPYHELKDESGDEHSSTCTHHHSITNNHINVSPSSIDADNDTPSLHRPKTSGSVNLNKSLINLSRTKHTKTKRRSKTQKSQQTVILHDADESIVDMDTSKTNDHQDNPTTSEELYTPQTPQPPKLYRLQSNVYHQDSRNEDAGLMEDYKERLSDEDNETIEHDHNDILSVTNANICHHATFQAINKDLSNLLLESDSADRYHPNTSSQEKLEKELAILQNNIFMNNIAMSNNDRDDDDDDDDDNDAYLYRTTSCSDTELNQYQEDNKMNRLILKDALSSGESRNRRERRPSNLFRKKTIGRWKIDDLEEEEHSMRKQIMHLEKMIGSHNKSSRSWSRRSSAKIEFSRRNSNNREFC